MSCIPQQCYSRPPTCRPFTPACFIFMVEIWRRAWLFPILLTASPLLLEIPPPSAITRIASIVVIGRASIECERWMNEVFTFNANLLFFTLFLFFLFTSVRLISRKRQNLSTVLPPPPISPLNMIKDAAYNREFNMMYLLIDEQEIWVYYTRCSLSNGFRAVVG